MTQRFVSLATLLLALSPAISLSNVAQTAPWFEHCLVGLEVGPTGSQFGSSTNDPGFAVNFNGSEIARAAKKSGAEYLVIWTREGDWAFYNSKLQPKPPGLGNRDVLQETVTEGRNLGLPIIAYCQVQYPGATLREHPDWRAVDPNGQPIDGRVCYRSGYLDYMKTMVEEQLAYGIDGFHLDMVDQGFGPPYGCWCTACQKDFQDHYRKPMPKSVAWNQDWDQMMEFRYASSERFEKALTEHIRTVKPGTTVDYNYHGNPPFSWEVGQRPVQHAGNGDFVTGETGVWGFSALTVSLNAEFYRAATPGARFQIAMQRGVRMYHDQTTRPLNDIRWELFTILAHGGFVTIVDKTGFDGWLDPVAYERFGLAFNEVRAKREHFGHRPVYEAGLYFSVRTRDWHGRENAAEYFKSFQGAQKAMEYEHIPWGVILDENATLDSLRKFPVIILPNVSILSDREAAMLRLYVMDGGKLIITGLSGTRDQWGEPQIESTLDDLIGARRTRDLQSTDNWMRFSPSDPSGMNASVESTLLAGIRRDWPFLVRGPAVVRSPTTAQPLGELMQPHRTSLHAQNRYNKDWPLSADKPVGAAVVLRSLGKGTVLTFAGSPDWATASDHHISETRKLLANAVRALHPDPRITIQAPINVQTVVSDDPANRILRVHLLGYNAPPQTTPAQNRPYVLPVPIEEAPLYRATLTLRDRPKRVGAYLNSTIVHRSGHTIQIEAEAIHEVITIGY